MPLIVFCIAFHAMLVPFCCCLLAKQVFFLFVKMPLFQPVELLVFTVNTVSSDSPIVESQELYRRTSLEGHFWGVCIIK